jgi:hypothetical protein
VKVGVSPADLKLRIIQVVYLLCVPIKVHTIRNRILIVGISPTRETAPIAGMLIVLPATLAAQVHRAEGRCLLEGQKLSVKKFLTLQVGTRTLIFCKREARKI